MRPGFLTRRFLLHYAEMVAVMFAGMGVLAVPAELALNAVGTSWDQLSDAGMLALMAATMTIPMVAWMRFRGHGWRPSLEMGASMVVPTLLAMAVLAAGLLDAGTVLVGEHVVMMVAMFGVMAARPEEYSHCRFDRRRATATASA
ncbi:MAG TPA: hypothetical protein VFR97_07590 [Capillimicrobium sp.]|nr:hypothetical protein [Capillimicrobium sp.]